LQDLNHAFCYLLDHCEYEALLDLFTDNATYIHGERTSVGHSEIQAVFAKRKAQTDRTARHVQTGLLLQQKSGKSASGYSTCVTFAANGSVPIPHAEPYLVADFEDEYELCPDQKWRISSRVIKRIFVAPQNSGPVGQ